MRIQGLLFTLIIAFNAFGQEATQQIRGVVTSASTANPVPGCPVHVCGSKEYLASTDSSGKYVLDVPIGEYTVRVQKAGFKTTVANEIVILAGKQYVLDLQLSELAMVLDSVTVQSDNSSREININDWKSQRFPASFYDPARIITSYAGAINANDEGNSISIYGTSPNYMQWKLEGVEVVNPNHLENSGSFNDKPSMNAGGVSILSAQLLQNSVFQYAPFPATSGNALSGNFDVKFRNGNNEKPERTVQAGLLGTDLSLEGPFSKKSSASYLFNYRYSTVGLLTQLGVDFGDEKINYQDLSFVISAPVTSHSVLKLFGVVGSCFNRFKGPSDSSLIESQKDLNNIDYASTTEITGVSYLTSINNSTYFKTVLVHSSKNISRETTPVSDWPGLSSENDFLKQEKLSSLVYLSKRVGKGISAKTGTYLNYFLSSMSSSLASETRYDRSLDEPLIQPFINMEMGFGKAAITGGLHAFIQPRINYADLEPRGDIKYAISDVQWLSLGYGKTSQLHPASLYLQLPENRNLRPSIVHAYELVHGINIGKVLLKNKLFYQDYRHIPVNSAFGFSAFNYLNEYAPFLLQPEGRAKVYGWDITIERKFGSWYVTASGALFNSLYSNDKTHYQESRFDSRYNAVLTTGKEFQWKKNRVFSIDLKGVTRDGFKESNPVTMEQVYANQLPTYYRMDLGLRLKRDRKTRSSIWALDIQNLTGRKNISYHYYDLFTGKIETKYQNGLIPVISYKVFF